VTLERVQDHPTLRMRERELERAGRRADRPRHVERRPDARDRGREVGDVDEGAAAEKHGAFDGVLQFAHVPRPAMGLERRPGGRREALDPTAGLRRRPAQEVVGEERDVGRPVAQRRHLDRDHVDPPEEVGAKPARGHESLEVLVGGEDDAGIDRVGPRAADRLELQRLQHAQQLHLERRRRRADLVEKDRAAVGLEKLSRPVPHGPGERPRHVAEEFALEQRVGHAAAGHFNEPARAAALPMDLAGEQRLAGAGLAGHEHAHRRAGHPFDDVGDPPHGGMRAEQGLMRDRRDDWLRHRRLRDRRLTPFS